MHRSFLRGLLVLFERIFSFHGVFGSCLSALLVSKGLWVLLERIAHFMGFWGLFERSALFMGSLGLV